MDIIVKDLNLMHINIRGLRRNSEEFVFTLNENKIDIASINKAFLRPRYKIKIPEYKIIRKGCSTGQGGGKVLIVKVDISFNNFQLNINNKSNEEYVTIENQYYRSLDELICSYYSLKGIVYEQLLEKLYKTIC